MQIEIDDELVKRVKNVLGDVSQEALEVAIAKLIRDTVEEDEKIPFGVVSAIAESLVEKKKQGLFRIKAWIPEVDPEEDMKYTREEAEKEKAQLEEMQPENKYEIEEVDE